MNFREKGEDQKAAEKRHHEITMARLNIQQTIANRPVNEYTMGALAIRWAGIVLVSLVAGVTVCNSIPRRLHKKDIIQINDQLSKIQTKCDAILLTQDPSKEYKKQEQPQQTSAKE